MCVSEPHYSEDFLFKLSRAAVSAREFVLVLEDDMVFSDLALSFITHLVSKRFDFVWCTLESPQVRQHTLSRGEFGLSLVRCQRLAYSGAVFYSRRTLQKLCEWALLTHLESLVWRYDIQFSSHACGMFGGVVWVSGEYFATEPAITSIVEQSKWVEQGRANTSQIDYFFDFTRAFKIV